MTTMQITFAVDTCSLPHMDEQHLAQLWHIGQANPAPYGDRDACRFVELVGREIVRRWLAAVPASLWNHQAAHVAALPSVAVGG